MNTKFIQTNGSTLTVHANGLADIDGTAIDNESIGMFIRQYSAELIERAYLDQKSSGCQYPKISCAVGDFNYCLTPNDCRRAQPPKKY